MVGAIYAMFLLFPVHYTMLISEDYWTEYGTFACFGLTGVILLVQAFKSGGGMQRGLWVLFGVVTIFIAGEEISWGQRMIGFDVPDFIESRNLQAESTLHNMYAVRGINHIVHGAVACLILLWILVSLVLEFRKVQLWEKMESLGIPLIPLRLVPLFFLQPLFFFFEITAKASELGELFLGIAALSWAVDLSFRNRVSAHYSSRRSVAVMLGYFFLVAVMSATLTHYYSTPPVWRLNMMASRDYPAYEMSAQSEEIYSYIYAHPNYLLADTRINHGKLLLEMGREQEAQEMLKQAIKDLESATISKEKRIKHQELLDSLLIQYNAE